MNERIIKLAEQAEEQVRLKCNNAYWRMSTELPEDCIWQEKFAELIVLECAEVCRQQQYYDADDEHKRGVNGGSITCMNAIKRYFGVEE